MPSRVYKANMKILLYNAIEIIRNINSGNFSFCSLFIKACSLLTLLFSLNRIYNMLI